MAVVRSMGRSAQVSRMSSVLSRFFSPIEWLLLRPVRRRLLRQATGPQILEVAFGSGQNLPYYMAGVEVTGVDCDGKRLKRSEARHSNNRILRYIMTCEQLRFNDARFDQVVGAFAIGRSTQAQAILREWSRVLKPKGRIHLMELGLPHNAALAMMLRLLRPLLGWAGVHVHSGMGDSISAAGLKLCRDEAHWGGLLHIYECARN